MKTKYRIVKEGNLFRIEYKIFFSWKTLRFYDPKIGPYATWIDTFEKAQNLVKKLTTPKNIEVVWEQK